MKWSAKSSAQGGKEKLLTIKTVRMIGNIEFSGQKIPFNVYAVDKTAYRTEFTFSGLTKGDLVEVTDLAGRLVYSVIAQNNQVTVDLTEKAKGSYQYRIFTDKREKQSGKLLLQ